MKINRELERELQESLYVHQSLPLHREKSLEAEFPKKKVTDKKNLWCGENEAYIPMARKEGSVCVVDTKEGRVLRLEAALTAKHWPEGAPADGDYTNYGTAAFTFAFEKENWEGYNRLHFKVHPLVETARVLHLNVAVTNVGKIAVPDPYFREGATVFDLKNEEWND